ncbi:MAG TPA: EAL domain-containing protein [Gaiellaceae bacterium]|jgi:diguanylate cyclase (GGDEF)-like protein|nr:EAL domain-containing protein [Gaiellaceae bacterium]
MGIASASDDTNRTRRFSLGFRAIWVYNVALVAAGIGAWYWLLGHFDQAPIVEVRPMHWWVIALLFYLAEAYVVHIQFRREAHTISLSEVALIPGLYILSPSGLLAASLSGAAVALIVVRRQRVEKLVFNLAQLALTTAVAVIVFRSVAALGDPLTELGWVAVIVAVIAASLTGIVLVTAAIAIAQGSLDLRQMPVAAGISFVAALGISNLVLIAIVLSRADREAIVLLILPAAIAAAVFRAFAAQARRHEHLEFLYESMKTTQGAPEFTLAVGQLLLTVRQLVRAEYAEIFLFPAGGENGLRSVLGRSAGMATASGPAEPSDTKTLEAIEAGGGCIVLPAPRPPHELDDYLATRALADGIVATLRGESGPFGLLVVGDRSGDVESFNSDDRRLLETFVGHASVMLENGRLERSLAQVNDLKERLRHQAYHDLLTGLPNRALFIERVQAALTHGSSSSSAVLFVDLDDFKGINDTLGHAVGDEVLVEIGRRVQRSVRQGDTAARLAGDEFAVLLESTDGQGAEIVATCMLESIQRPIMLHGRETRLNSSIGIALSHDGITADELLLNADVAMYSAKQSGKHRTARYAPEMHAQVRRRHEFAVELQRGLERDEIGVVFEPIVDLRDGKIVAFEALARWYSPERGLVGPGEFIPVAEEIGLMEKLGNQVLRKACEAAAGWQQAHPVYGQVAVSVNLSPSELGSETLVRDVARVLKDSKLPPESLMLEITESEVMRDLDMAHARIAELRALGLRLVLDDFGTGRSSLERLGTFPLDALKIAKPFVDRLLDPGAESGFIDTFVRLTQSLEIECIAEGIEYASQARTLLQRGCVLGQGFHFARSMTGEELEEFLGLPATQLAAVG